uniref:Uncharacterized protein n=1 Tax=Arundo donax TaxID=35708 RepID=A0A0A9H2J4_ARUDO
MSLMRVMHFIGTLCFSKAHHITSVVSYRRPSLSQ